MEKYPLRDNLLECDLEVKKKLNVLTIEIWNSIENYKFKDAQSKAIEIARMGNKYLTDTKPWSFLKTDIVIAGSILNIAIQLCANLSIVLEPFIPSTCKRIRNMLGMRNIDYTKAGTIDILSPYHKIGMKEILFSRIDDEIIDRQYKKLDRNKYNNLPNKPFKSTITIKDFEKIDLRVGTVSYAERVANTSKFLKINIDSGNDKLTIVTPVGHLFSPEEFQGKQVIFIVNLIPITIKEIKSEGMILYAKNKDNTLTLIETSSIANNGSMVVLN